MSRIFNYIIIVLGISTLGLFIYAMESYDEPITPTGEEVKSNKKNVY